MRSFQAHSSRQRAKKGLGHRYMGRIFANDRPSIAPNVIVEDDLPFLPEGAEALDFRTTHGEWTQSWPDRPFRADLGRLAPSQTATLRFSVFFPGGVTSENTATVQSDIAGPDASNNQATI
jgi:hypothetical protein